MGDAGSYLGVAAALPGPGSRLPLTFIRKLPRLRSISWLAANVLIALDPIAHRPCTIPLPASTSICLTVVHAYAIPVVSWPSVVLGAVALLNDSGCNGGYQCSLRRSSVSKLEFL